ncbi:MAG: helix-turn-helix domain-containing protein [Coprococcus sp.]
MDITERIRQLNSMRGWTIYKLAKEARVSPSTLTNMIRRGNSPSLSTLERLCNAYGITFVQFFYDNEDMVQLTDDQREHLEKWNRLTERQKKAVDLFIQGLMQME